MLRIKELNEQIVEARKQGQHQRVHALKLKVQDMLILHSIGAQRKNTQQEPSTPPPHSTTTIINSASTVAKDNVDQATGSGNLEGRSHQKRSENAESDGQSSQSPMMNESGGAPKTLSAKELMAQIQALNLEIVAARKQGQLNRASQLQEEVKHLMMQGVALG